MSQAPESSKTVDTDQATNLGGTVNDSQISTDGERNANKISGNNKLSFDWGPVVQKGNAFRIPELPYMAETN